MTRLELEHRPGTLGRDIPPPAIRVDDDRMSDRLEERQIGVAVGVRRALREVIALALGESTYAIGLCLRMERPHGTAGVLPVLHLDDGAERTVEAEVLCDRVDDL